MNSSDIEPVNDCIKCKVCGSTSGNLKKIFHYYTCKYAIYNETIKSTSKNSDNFTVDRIGNLRIITNNGKLFLIMEENVKGDIECYLCQRF
jgi:hypothetical protein